jgi:hypothetical protein
MHVQFNTDHNIDGHARLQQYANDAIADTLGRFAERITRVEVHLSDVNSATKGGKDDHRCLLEARLANLNPVSVSHLAPTREEALDGALDKLERLIDSTLGKIFDPKGGPSFGDQPA